MAKGFLDHIQLDVPCPKCGEKVQASIGTLRTNPDLECAACGSVFSVEADQADDSLRAIDKQVKGIGKGLKGFKKR